MAKWWAWLSWQSAGLWPRRSRVRVPSPTPSFGSRLTEYGPVAQLVEQGTLNPKVQGSNPCRSTIEFQSSNPGAFFMSRGVARVRTREGARRQWRLAGRGRRPRPMSVAPGGAANPCRSTIEFQSPNPGAFFMSGEVVSPGADRSRPVRRWGRNEPPLRPRERTSGDPSVAGAGTSPRCVPGSGPVATRPSLGPEPVPVASPGADRWRPVRRWGRNEPPLRLCQRTSLLPLQPRARAHPHKFDMRLA